MRWGDTPRAVAEASDVVLSMVTDGEAVRAVALGDYGIISGLKPGGIYADMSTIAPDASRAVAAKFAERGHTMLDAPLSGSPVTLAQGNASVMVGGDPQAFERAKPVLLAIGPKVTHIGANGLACQMKIAVNLLLMVEVIAFGEAVALAEKGGVGRDIAVDAILKSVAASPVLGYRGPFILEGKMPAVPLADVTLQQKDMVLALDFGRKLGSPVRAGGCRQRDDECLSRPRHRSPRLRHRARGLSPSRRTVASEMYRTNLRDVPQVSGLKRDDGWVDMQVQFLIDKKSAGADNVVGWTVLKPGARHERHRHHNCDEFFIVLKGHGHIYNDDGEEPSGEGDVVYSPRDCWHGFNNTSDADVVLVWGWMGAGSIEDSGYEVDPDSH